MDIPGFNNPIAQQCTGLPMEDLIGGPMSAISKANAMLKTNDLGKESNYLKDRYINYMRDTFACEHEFSSSETSDSIEYKCPNGKIFARVYKCKISGVGCDYNLEVWKIDLKCEIDENNWETVLFFPSCEFENIVKLTESSYNNVK